MSTSPADGVLEAPTATRSNEKTSLEKPGSTPAYIVDTDSDVVENEPTEEDLKTLPRISGPINWAIYTIAFAELCERFSYYGSAVLYTNFVNRPLPEGSTTGASHGTSANTPGALGMGTKAAQGISLVNQFWAYLMPLFGAWLADAKYGRYKVIHVAIAVSTIAHVILTAAASPKVIVHKDNAFAAFFIGMFTLCCGTGLFKANISPLLAEQNQDTRMRVEVRNGQRVIVDPAITNSRIFLYFYFAINIGAVAGQVSMVWVEKYVGFWLAFLLPTALFLICPVVLWWNHKQYILSPPTGSVLSKFMHMMVHTAKRSKSIFHFDWDQARPSHLIPTERPAWMTYDDAWVDEVRRGLMACKVFLFLPVFHLAYNQMTGNLTSQAATMQLHGAPNDLIQNLNPISIVIMVPLFDHLLYPGLRKIGISFTPIKRMATGFFFGAASMVAAAVMQHYIYKKSPCGKYANGEGCDPAPINVWAQSLPYILIGISEIFTNVTSYEYAYSKAPENMRSLVMSVNLFMSAFASALGQAFTPLSGDPLLVWNYVTVAIIAFLGGAGFWICFRKLDRDEDKLNLLQSSKFKGNNQPQAATAEQVAHEAAEVEKKV
ncbi:hypothetical protein TD95_002802 [Thielaviopsis punctulata]|uniref:Major facilitator superfamily (MFS) profile domain-containing protein n=1 Tax=Thielaviopsis punctulata TaxID=72032 RepID=A0A0F4ZHS5_9PEZI|nr:hypothetical protein TD95_002802 [Thielaviopsis punctulata]